METTPKVEIPEKIETKVEAPKVEVPKPEVEEPKHAQTHEYDIVSFMGMGGMTADKLETHLNDRAKEGWRLKLATKLPDSSEEVAIMERPFNVEQRGKSGKRE